MSESDKNILVVSDLLHPPYDEGAKIAVMHTAEQLCRQLKQSKIILLKNKLYSFSAIRTLLLNKTNYILYIPSASITFNSFLRAKMISMLTRNKVIMISTQPRRYTSWQISIIRRIQPLALFVQSREHLQRLKNYGLKNIFVNTWGVNLEKFTPVDSATKSRLRKKFLIPEHKRVYLHFGHLKENRNFKELMPLLTDHQNYVLIVCSTTTRQKMTLKHQLEQKGFHFITEFISENHELYQLSDYYVFPTRDPMSAIEFPLSVFEALACGIPVYHKSFGALKDYFQDSFSNLCHYNSPEDLKISNFSTDNLFPIHDYSWRKATKNLINQIGKIYV